MSEFGGLRLSPEFSAYLVSRGTSVPDVEVGRIALRCKPYQGAYGCYGHVKGVAGDGRFRRELRAGLRNWNSFVVQPEMTLPTIINITSGSEFTYIDRNFFGWSDGLPRFLGGLRSLMPTASIEAKQGRNHGNANTVYAEITA